MKIIRYRKNSKKPAEPWKKVPGNVYDEDKINEFLSEGWNYGILTGETSNITVLDIDTEGLKRWNRIIKLFKVETLTVQSPSGGFHYYFQYDPDIKSGVAETGIEIKNDKMQITGPGSKIDGKEYKTINDSDINSIPGPLKSYLVSAMNEKKKEWDNEIVEEGERNNYLFRYGCKKIKDIKDDETLRQTIWLQNFKVCQPPFSEHNEDERREVERIIDSVIERREEISKSGFNEEEWIKIILGSSGYAYNTNKRKYIGWASFKALFNKAASDWWEQAEPYYGFCLKEQKEGYYDVWDGWPHEPIKGDCDIFLEHCRNLVSNDEEYEYLLDWMAAPFHDIKPRVALVLLGEKGSGKTMFSNIYSKLFGGRYVARANHNTFSSRFNSEIENKLLFIGDELGDYSDRTDLKIKALITDDYITIEGKGKQAESAKNYLQVIMTSNEKPVKVTADERRYFVLETEKKWSQERYGALYDHMNKEESLQALMYLLMNREINRNFVSTLPITDALVESFEESDSVYSWLAEEEPMIHNEKTEDVYDQYKQWCLESGIKYPVKRQTMIKRVKMWGYTTERIKFDGKKKKVFVRF